MWTTDNKQARQAREKELQSRFNFIIEVNSFAEVLFYYTYYAAGDSIVVGAIHLTGQHHT